MPPAPLNEIQMRRPKWKPFATELVQWNGSPRLRSRPIRIASSPSTAHQYAIAHSRIPYPRFVLRLRS
eukprot:3342258-Prymnesium_polylepis.1